MRTTGNENDHDTSDMVMTTANLAITARDGMTATMRAAEDLQTGMIERDDPGLQTGTGEMAAAVAAKGRRTRATVIETTPIEGGEMSTIAGEEMKLINDGEETKQTVEIIEIVGRMTVTSAKATIVITDETTQTAVDEVLHMPIDLFSRMNAPTIVDVCRVRRRPRSFHVLCLPAFPDWSASRVCGWLITIFQVPLCYLLAPPPAAVDIPPHAALLRREKRLTITLKKVRPVCVIIRHERDGDSFGSRCPVGIFATRAEVIHI